MSAVDFSTINPVSKSDLASFALIADTQFAEEMGSESFNRKFTGIVPAGIYRGFEFAIASSNSLLIGAVGKNTAAIERDGQIITVQGQHPVPVIIPHGYEVAVVIEAISQHGLLTRQVDKNSLTVAAEIKVVPIAEVLAHHVIIVTANLPVGGSLNPDHLSIVRRTAAGVGNTPTFEQADSRYQLKGEYVTQTQFEEKLKKATEADPVTAPGDLPQSGVVILEAAVNSQLVTAPNNSLLTIFVSKEIDFKAGKPALLAPAGESIKTKTGNFSKVNFGNGGEFKFSRSAGQWKQLS